MERSQRYIGTPCGLVVCIDQKDSGRMSGRFYHFYSREGMGFRTLEELVFGMERFYDGINFPYPSDKLRGFMGSIQGGNRKKEGRKVMKEEELLKKHGDLGTFIVRVQHRQNSSWQGRITWSDRNKTVNFRSVWEMVRLMEDALDKVSEPEGDTEKMSWPKE